MARVVARMVLKEAYIVILCMRDLDIHDKVAYDVSFIFARPLLHGRRPFYMQNFNILVNFRR